MTKAPLLLAIDQGTTSSRAILFEEGFQPLATAQRELPQVYPAPGHVEHDAHRILEDTLATCREVLASHPDALDRVASIGITNQRETVVLWDRKTGKALHNALVWQDRRTAEACRALRENGIEEEVRARTGLLLDPYFSATKIAWMLDEVDGARAAAERGELAVGTIDCWLLWHLTAGKVHATDPSNASRTLLYDITELRWDPWLCEQLRIPTGLLPEVRPTCGDFGTTDAQLFGRALPIGAMVGDQQAATLGQGCLEPGTMKCTFGTGAFAMQNTGERCLVESRRLLTTLLWQHPGGVQYALEGSIFSAGSAIQWLRDGLGLIGHAQETEALARRADPDAQVYLVPAFTGLGAPWWDPHARASLLGITRGTGRPEIVRAALEAACFQTRDLLETAADDGAPLPANLRVDGGLCNNAWFLQFLADMLDLPIVRPAQVETTALGAAFCAGLTAGLHDLDSGSTPEE
jgi:glycerol kinase